MIKGFHLLNEKSYRVTNPQLTITDKQGTGFFSPSDHGRNHEDERRVKNKS